jgi:uncharacterized protein YkwD
MSLEHRVLAVAAALLTGVGAAASSGLGSGAGGCTAGATWGTPRENLAPAVIQLVNTHRATLGLQPLHSSASLTASAIWKARHMARYGYFGHDDPAPPVARSALDRIRACGYAGAYVGENIAAGFRTPAVVMQAWLNSPGHRAAIENNRFAAIGVGVATSADGRFFWVQDFGSSDDQAAAGILQARGDVRVTRKNRRLVIKVLDNDRHAAGAQLAVTGLTARPRHGRAVASSARIRYRPARNFVGRDTFRYAVTDGLGGHSTARVVVRVTRR